MSRGFTPVRSRDMVTTCMGSFPARDRGVSYGAPALNASAGTGPVGGFRLVGALHSTGDSRATPGYGRTFLWFGYEAYGRKYENYGRKKPGATEMGLLLRFVPAPAPAGCRDFCHGCGRDVVW